MHAKRASICLYSVLMLVQCNTSICQHHRQVYRESITCKPPFPPPHLRPSIQRLLCQATAHLSTLRYVYDGEFEGQMSMLHDANKRLIKVSDIYPEFTDLKKGDYIIRLHLRHDDAALLDKMKDVPVVVERKLKEPLTVPVYATVREAVKAAKPVKERSLFAGKPYSYAPAKLQDTAELLPKFLPKVS